MQAIGERIDVRLKGVLCGVLMIGGSVTNEQLMGTKRAGVPTIVERRSETKSAPHHISGFFFRVPKDFDQDISVKHLVPDGYEPTERLKLGRVIRVDWYQTDDHTLQECLSFIADKGGLLVGPQALFLLWQKKGKKFPKKLWALSLDKEEGLLKMPIEGPYLPGRFNLCIPAIFKSPTLGNEIHLIVTNGVLSNKNCFAVITYAR